MQKQTQQPHNVDHLVRMFSPAVHAELCGLYDDVGRDNHPTLEHSREVAYEKLALMYLRSAQALRRHEAIKLTFHKFLRVFGRVDKQTLRDDKRHIVQLDKVLADPTGHVSHPDAYKRARRTLYRKYRDFMPH